MTTLIVVGINLFWLIAASYFARKVARTVHEQTINMVGSRVLWQAAELGLTEKEAETIIGTALEKLYEPLPINDRQLRWKFSNNRGLGDES